jgi:hypothetical protein
VNILVNFFDIYRMIEFGKWFSDGCSSLFSGMDSIMVSPILLSVIISAVMLLIVVMLYPARKGSSGSILLRILLYNFMTTLVIVLVHDMALKKCARSSEYDDVLGKRSALSDHIDVMNADPASVANASNANTSKTGASEVVMPGAPVVPTAPNIPSMPNESDEVFAP